MIIHVKCMLKIFYKSIFASAFGNVSDMQIDASFNVLREKLDFSSIDIQNFSMQHAMCL